jgi:hypothetical protein
MAGFARLLFAAVHAALAGQASIMPVDASPLYAVIM